MKQLIVIETLRAIPGKAGALKTALLEMVPLTLKEPGCMSYEIAESATDQEMFLVLMRWESMAGIEGHNQAMHILDFVKKYDRVLYGEVTESHWFTC